VFISADYKKLVMPVSRALLLVALQTP